MKKIIANIIAGVILCMSLCVLLMQGFGLPPVGSVLDLVLRIVVGAAAQVLFCLNCKRAWLRVIPLVLTVTFALWGGWLFLTSDSWANATFGGYFADYCSPAVGCVLAYILCTISTTK